MLKAKGALCRAVPSSTPFLACRKASAPATPSEPLMPSVNPTLNQTACDRVPRLGSFEHFGIQVQSPAAVEALLAGFEQAELEPRFEHQTT